jgi:hypothetical protein
MNDFRMVSCGTIALTRRVSIALVTATICSVLLSRGKCSSRLYLCFREVCDPFRRQDIRHVKTCDTNPAVSHPIIDVEAIG